MNQGRTALKRLDEQLAQFEANLIRQVGLAKDESQRVATLIAADIRFLPTDVKIAIREASPVPMRARYEELIAFQKWNDFSISLASRPEIVRAQVIVQNYVCFGYLKDACFEVMAQNAKSHSVAARCARFLTIGAVRDFRNAFAHANWCYSADFSRLDCWVRDDARRKDSQLRAFQVSQHDLDFWQALAKGVAYAMYEHIAV